MLVTVLKDEIAAGMKDVLRENLVRERFQSIKRIRRVREYDVELLVTDREEVKDIVPDHSDIVKPKTLGLSLNKGGVLPRHLNRIDPGGTSGGEFEGDSTSTTEKVKDLQVFELIFIIKNIK